MEAPDAPGKLTRCLQSYCNKQPGPSTYVDDDYYQRLYGIAKEWSNPGQPVASELHHEISALLNRECRLLDDSRFEEWLDLFQEQCVYWIPSDVNAP